MHHRASLAFFVALSLSLTGAAVDAQAQATEFTGVITRATLPSFCQEETHYLTCTGFTPSSPTGVLLKSSTLDLDKYVGKNWKFNAVLAGVECDIWDVTSVAAPTATLVTCGTPSPGCTMRFRVGPTGVIGRFWLLWSRTSSFRPTPGPVRGTLLLGSAHSFATGPTYGTGAEVDFELPPFVSLIGIDIWMQGARQDIGPIGPLELTNSICFTVLPTTGPCVQPGC
jgi:hypothetical protein